MADGTCDDSPFMARDDGTARYTKEYPMWDYNNTKEYAMLNSPQE